MPWLNGSFKDLPRRTVSNKVLCDKAFNIAKNPKYDGYQKRFASMVYKYFDKRSALLVWSKNLRSEALRSETLAKRATRDKSNGAVKSEIRQAKN